jgi:hypothetical protein
MTIKLNDIDLNSSILPLFRVDREVEYKQLKFTKNKSKGLDGSHLLEELKDFKFGYVEIPYIDISTTFRVLSSY